MTKRLFYTPLLLLVTLVVCWPAHATVFLYEGFEGYTTGSIVGQTMTGTGFASGAWAYQSGPTPPQISTSSLTSDQLPPSQGGSVVTQGYDTRTSGDIDTSATGKFAQAGLVDGGLVGGGSVDGEIYITFLGRSNSGSQATGSACCFAEVGFLGVTGFGIGKHNASSNYSLNYGGNLIQADLGSGTAVDTETHLFLAKVDFNAFADDEVTVWLDPDLSLGEFGQDPASMTTFFADVAFDRIQFRSGNVSEFWQFDELRISSTFAVPGPAPMPVLLLGIAMIGLGIRRYENKDR